MATLGALLSQQLGFTVTTSIGTVYTHGLGFTPTLVLLTNFGTAQTGAVVPGFMPCYTLANSVTITIQSWGGFCDVLCGSIHSLVR